MFLPDFMIPERSFLSYRQVTYIKYVRNIQSQIYWVQEPT